MTLFDVIIGCLYSEMKKIQSSAIQHVQSVLNGHERLKLQLESQKRELEFRRIELQKRETHNESERKKLEEDIMEVVFLFLLHLFYHAVIEIPMK